ncbi:MAG: RagB/SusD family nutrient uptake outer membrane protein [Prolixibacteraceae bacterium]
MKKCIILILVGLAGGLISCNDEFLERSPDTLITDGGFWKTENDLKLYINNFYNQSGFFLQYTGYNQGPYAEDATAGSDIYISINYNLKMNGESTLPASGGGWAAGDWTLLRNVNYFMDHYKQVEASGNSAKQYVGEALFFRSIFYFNKLRSFGDVPWASTTVTMDSELLFSKRMPRNQVTDSIMHDLDLAVEYLPARAGGNWTGRVTKETALALQARIALYEGTWERYHAKKNTPFKVAGSDGTKLIQKAADVAGTLIALSEANGFPGLSNAGIENGYWLLFNQKDYSNQKEILFWRKYSLEDGLYTRRIRYTGTGGSNGLTKSMIDSYLCTDGKPIAVSSLYGGDKNLKTVVTNRDPRLNQTVRVDDGKHLLWDNPVKYFTLPSFTAINDQKCVTGYELSKGHDPDFAQFNNETKSTAGTIYFRYAETLLIYAEAKAELGTITQNDIDKTINALRKRVGMNNGLLKMNDITPDPDWEFKDLSPLLQEIRRERKVELVCEGFRVEDLYRWAAIDELIVGKRPLGAVRKQWENYPGADETFTNAVLTLPVDDNGYIDPYKGRLNAGFQFDLGRDYLSPIPTTELVLNQNLTQNPGW